MSNTQCILVTSVLSLVHSQNDLQSTLIDGNSRFGHDVSSTVFEDASTNIWISPFSITSCFSLIYPGSGGQTQSEIAEIMGYPTDSSTDEVAQEYFTLQSSIESMYDGSRIGEHSARRTMIGIANKIFSAHDLVLKQSYIDALSDGGESFIDAEFDFAAQNATILINEWVNDNTNGLIEEILPEDEDISNRVCVTVCESAWGSGCVRVGGSA